MPNLPANATHVPIEDLDATHIGKVAQFQYPTAERYDIGVIELIASDKSSITVYLRGGSNAIQIRNGEPSSANVFVLG